MAKGNGIVINISGSGEGAAEALRMIETKMKETADHGHEMSERLRESTERVRSAFELMGIGLGIHEAIDGFKELIEKSIETAVELKHVSEQTGISTQNLSVLKFMSEQTGVSFETLSKGFKKLSSDMYGGEEGSKTFQKALQTLGISTAQYNATGGDLFKVMELIADKMKEMPDGFQKNAVATALFGKAGQQLIPVLNEGAEGMEAYRSKAQALGLVLDDAGIQKMEELHKSLNSLKGAWSGFGLELTSFVTPALKGAAEVMSHMLEMMHDSAWQTMKGIAGAAINQAVPGMGDALQNSAIDHFMKMATPPAPGEAAKSGADSSFGGADDTGGDSARADAFATADMYAKIQRQRYATSVIWQRMQEFFRSDDLAAGKADAERELKSQVAAAQKTIDTAFAAHPVKLQLQTVTEDLLGPEKQQNPFTAGGPEQATRMIGGFMDQLTEQAVRGKVSFRSLVDSAISDLERWAMSIMEQRFLLPLLSSMFGASGVEGFDAQGMAFDRNGNGFAGLMAGGGSLSGNGDWAIVGDSPSGDMSNAEAFAPSGPGTVVPHDVLAGIASGKGGGGAAPNVQVNVINNSSAQVAARPGGVSFDSAAKNFVIHTVLEDMSQGGALSGAMGGAR